MDGRTALSRLALGLALGACSPAHGADRPPADGRASARDDVDVVQVTLPGWTATEGRTPFERFVDWREATGACAVRVTHPFPPRPGEPPIQPSPVTVLGRRDVAIDGQPFALLRTSDPGEPQTVSVTRDGRTAILRFTGCDDATIDRVLAQTHLASGAPR